MKKAISRNGIILATFAIVATLVVAVVNELTKDRIAQQAQKQLLTTLNTIIDSSTYNNDIHTKCVVVNDEELLGTKENLSAYLALFDDQPVAAAIETIAPDGYNGNIKLFVAITISGEVSGVRVLSHQETPGLGDKIEIRKNSWITSFNGQILNNDNESQWQVKKDGGMFDQFTGATITPRAVVNAVKNTVIYFNKNQEQLFSQSTPCRSELDK